jgi:excisionase family DNA binding protein
MNTAMNSSQARALFSPLTSISTGFFSIAEAAAMTKTGEETIRRAIRAGRIPAYGTRGRLRVRLSDVLPKYAPERKAAQV